MERLDINPRTVSVTVEARVDGHFYYGEGTSRSEAIDDLYRVLEKEGK